MIYIFDKKQAIIKVLTNDDFTAAHLNFKINTATTFEFSLPASKALPSGSKYVATPHPLNDSKFIMLRLTERVDNTETIDYSAHELAYQELATDGYIEDKRPQNQSALNLMKIALNGSNWELNNVNVSGTATTNFYYVDRLSAISKVVDLLGGEIVFYIEIQGNAISGRYMDYLARQGADTSKVFASGSNLLTVERQSDTSNIYTAILPRGKGEEIDNGKADTPDGYGRRINIADVEWKRSAGKPLDKPKGSIILSDSDATAEWGQINGNARLLLQTYDDIDDVNVLINSAYKTLQSVNHPQIQYSATVADVGGLSLGDTVLIMHGDRNLSYKTRVFEVKYDLLSPDQTELSLGDDLSSNSITSQINNLNAVADTASSQTQWTINQIGRPSTTFGNTEPANPKVGDVFFKELPDGGTEIHRWNGNIWELLASPTTADDIAKAVDDAVSQAKSHTDEVKQVLSSDIATATSQAASQASTAEANAKSEAVSQFNRAQNALSAAKTDLTNGIASEASARTQAVAAANSQAQAYVNQAKSDITDTINALSVGGRNYVLNSNVSTTSNITGFYSSVPSSYFNHKKITVSVQVDYDNITSLSDAKRLGVEFVILNKDGSERFIGSWKYPAVGDSFHGRISTTWDLSNNEFKDYPTTQMFQGIYVQGITGTNVSVSKPKLEIGNKATDWTQAPEDVVLDYTTKDNQIKETITQYQDTNDGKVRKAQTDATTALGLVETKVSQTDYDQKTGDLSTKINDVKDTADRSAQTISDIQEADGKRDSRISEVEKTAGEIKSTVSDLSTAQDKQSGYISTLQQRADGFESTVTKVDNLSIGGRNLLLGTRDWTDNTRWNQQGTVTTDMYMGMIIASTKWAWSSPTYNIRYANILQVGKTYTFSTYVRNTSDTDTKVTGFYDYGRISVGVDTTPLPAHTDWMGVSITFKVMNNPADSGWGLRWEGHNELANGFIQFAGYKLEEGNIATDWTPAPEDVQSDIAQVKVTADGISKFVRDSSGNISSNFQTALSKTSIITGSTLATSIQKQTATQITSALTDNNGKIISLINQDSSGVQIAGNNIILDGNTTVTGDFYAKGGNFKNLNASNLTVGTLNGNQVNITNIDASNITTGVLNSLIANSMTLNAGTINGAAIYVTSMQNQIDGTTQNVRLGINPNWQHQLHIEPVNQSSGWYHYLYAGNDHLFLGAWDGSNSNTYDNRVALFTEGGSSEIDVGTIRLRSSGSAIYDNGWGSIDGVTSISMKGSDPSYTSMYVGVGNNGTGEFRVVTNATIGTSELNYADARAAHWYTSSLAKYKTNISEIEDGSALAMINRAGIYKYQFKTDVTAGNDKYTFGPVIGDDYLNNPVEFLDSTQEGTDDHSASWITMKALQEEDSKVESLIARIEELEEKLESKGK